MKRLPWWLVSLVFVLPVLRASGCNPLPAEGGGAATESVHPGAKPAGKYVTHACANCGS
jgi:hypothetical protein